MTGEGDNENDEYYIPIETIAGQRIVKPNQFGQATIIEIGIITCKCNDFLKTSQTGLI